MTKFQMKCAVIFLSLSLSLYLSISLSISLSLTLTLLICLYNNLILSPPSFSRTHTPSFCLSLSLCLPLFFSRQCGGGYTSKLEGMLSDFQLAADMNKEWETVFTTWRGQQTNPALVSSFFLFYFIQQTVTFFIILILYLLFDLDSFFLRTRTF